MKSVQSLLLLLCAALASAKAQDGSIVVIDQTGQGTSGLTGNVISFTTPTLNNSGKVAFGAGTNGAVGTGTQAIYLFNGSGLQQIVSDTTAAPLINGVFQILDTAMISENGTVAFSGQNWSTGEADYVSSGSGLTGIAGTGQAQNFTDLSKMALSDTLSILFQGDVTVNGNLTSRGLYAGTSSGFNLVAGLTTTAPGLGNLFTAFGSSPIINNVGVVGFQGSTSTGQGLYTSRGGGALTTIATTLTIAPGLNQAFALFGEKPALNDSGTLAFFGATGTAGTSPQGIFLGSGASITAVATTAQAAPGLVGNFKRFATPSINNAGTAAFRGTDSQFNDGIYSGNGGTLRTIATMALNQQVPHLGGSFSSFGNPVINTGGTVAFMGNAADASGNSLGNGIFLGDGQELIAAAFAGQSAGGSTITSVNFGGGADRGGASQFNDNGQIAYQATLANKSSIVALFTPTLHYRSSTSGAWGSRANWTVSIQPAAVHDVFIDPTSTLTVTGPSAPVTVKSLTVNGTGGATATLSLQNMGTLTVSSGATNGANGALTGSGKINGNLTSAGLLSPGLGATTGSLSVNGNVTLQATSHLALDLGGLIRKTNYDFLGVSGAFALGGELDVSLLGGFVPQAGQTFDLFDAASTSGAFGLVNLPSLTGGLTWNTTLLTATGVISVNASTPLPSNWSGAPGGQWTDPTKWGGTVPNAPGALATFSATGGTPTSIAVNGPKTVGSMVFNSTGSFLVTGTASDVITLNNGTGTAPSIATTAGSHVIAAPLALQQDALLTASANTTLSLTGGITGAHNLSTNGPGTVNLSGAQGYSGLNASAGTTNLNGSFAGGAITATGNAKLNINASQVLTSLNIGGTGLTDFEPSATDTASTVVPEPGTVALLASWSLIILWRFRRARTAR